MLRSCFKLSQTWQQEHCTEGLAGASDSWNGHPKTSPKAQAMLSSLTNLQAVCSCHSQKRGYKLQLRVTFWLQSGLSCHYVSFLRGKCWCTPCLQWIWIYTLLQQSFWRRGSFELLWKTFLKIKIAEARHRKWATGFKTLHPSQLQVLEFLPAVLNASVWMRLWRILLAGVVPSGALLPSACRISYILEHTNYLWRVSTWKKLKL